MFSFDSLSSMAARIRLDGLRQEAVYGNQDIMLVAIANDGLNQRKSAADDATKARFYLGSLEAYNDAPPNPSFLYFSIASFRSP
jgi:hypothetical protein